MSTINDFQGAGLSSVRDSQDDGGRSMASLVRPPGPKNRGIVGNFPMGSADPLGLFTKWAQEYGGIFYYRVLSRHVYFLNHPELVKDVLVTQHDHFIKGEAVRFNRRVFGDGLVANEGSSWRSAAEADRAADIGNLIRRLGWQAASSSDLACQPARGKLAAASSPSRQPA